MHVNTENFQVLQNSVGFESNDLDAHDLINGSPRSSDSGIESDCTDGNLSWLLNYKIHELPPVPGKSVKNLLLFFRVASQLFQQF